MIEPQDLSAKLEFRKADPKDAEHLKSMYEGSWGCGITISCDQIRSMITCFPEGQIVGQEPGSGVPVTMINIMLGVFDPREGFPRGYDHLTGGRTFSTHMSLERLSDALDSIPYSLGIAYCVSIIADRKRARMGYAVETLNHAIGFANANGLVPVPYSAPRGFGAARIANPGIGILDYLHMTRPSESGAGNPSRRLEILNGLHDGSAHRMELKMAEGFFERYHGMPADPIDGSSTAFANFISNEGDVFYRIFGRSVTIEDFCLLTQRGLADPVMNMHMENGARFIRDAGGRITAIFEDSRPEDIAAAGYNIVLSYGYHGILGHDFAT